MDRIRSSAGAPLAPTAGGTAGVTTTPELPPEPEEISPGSGGENLLVYLLLGVFFGVVLVKSEVVSWFRIQEMFRFQSFHMYGIIGCAVVVAALSVALIQRFGVTTVRGEPARIAPKEYDRGVAQLAGGTIFGLGWALLGACPGPVYALIGSGVTVMIVALLSAAAGAWVYGHLRPKLPH